MECKAITNEGMQCSRIAESGSKYCWQHRNYDLKENISTQYFQNVPLLENTLLTYFDEEEPLKNINKQFQNLNYEKYNTHIEPHGVKISYYPDTKIIEEKVTYANGKLNGLYEEYYSNGTLKLKTYYKNDLKNGLSEQWHNNGRKWIRSNYKDGELDGLYEAWYSNGLLFEKKTL